MPGRLYARGAHARRELLRGVDVVADLVGPTLGPRGRHVVLQRLDAPPLITNDGVTIARSLELLRDPLANQGVQLLREVAATTDTFVGDGTTTASLLARAILRDALRQVAAGADPVGLGRGLEAGVADAVAYIEARSRPGTNEVARVATVAARDARIGALVAEALEAVGPEGLVRVEDDAAYGVRLDVRRGMRFDSGVLSPALLVNPADREAVFEDPLILTADERITEVAQLVGVLSAAASARRPLLVVADEVSGDALRLLVANVRRRGLPVSAVRAPGFGPDRSAALQDIATRTGGVVLGPGLGRGVARATLTDLGTACRVVAGVDATTIVDGAGDPAAIGRRGRQIAAAIAYEASEYERDKHRARLARLDGALAVVRVGLDTETEQEETRHRIRDAIGAGRAAITHGVVPGGGAALVHAARAVAAGGTDDESRGRSVIRTSLEAPLRQLATNAGQDPSVAVRDVSRAPWTHGLDVTRHQLRDLTTAGVLDPTLVVCGALQIAASIARTCLRSEAIIAEPPTRIARRPHHPHGHHHHGDPEGHTHMSRHDHAHEH